MSALTERLRDLVDPVGSRHRSRPLRDALALAALIALSIYMALTHNIPLINGKPGERLRADFAFANQVVPGQTPVRVDGVDVGQVDKIGAGEDPRRATRVEMRITKKGLVIHEDARAEIRWRTLLGGNMYIDLVPGSASSPKMEDGVIPVSRTGNQAEFDDLLQPYDGGTEQAQRDILAGLETSFSDPQVTRAAIDALPGLDPVRRGLEPVMGTQRGDLRAMIASTAKTVDALGADTAALRGLVTGARQTLGATTARRQELGEFLELGPSTLDETLTTMTRLRRTLNHLDPLVERLRPGARRIAPAANAARPALADADRLLRQARPVLADLRPAFDDLRAAADSAVPVVQGLEPTVARLNDEILPFLAERDDEMKLRNYEAIGPFFSVLAMAAAEYDAVGHRLHLSTPAANNSVISLFSMQFAKACGSPAAGCKHLGKALAQSWFGRGKAKK